RFSVELHDEREDQTTQAPQTTSNPFLLLLQLYLAALSQRSSSAGFPFLPQYGYYNPYGAYGGYWPYYYYG
uniref:Secreted protein n=1 Tax=Loa loa TaxID=7209 RepID=A0A1I7VED4_LOALO